MRNVLIIILMLTIYSCAKQERVNFNSIEYIKIYETNTITDIDPTSSPISACIDPQGDVHVLIPVNSTYVRLDTTGKVVTVVQLSQSEYGELLLPTALQVDNGQIVIFDSYRRLLVFFDYEFKILKKVRLNRFPNKFKIDGDFLYYSADFLTKVDSGGRCEIFYGNKVYKQHLITKQEDVIYAMDSITLSQVLVQLDLRYPLLLDFDYNKKSKYIIYSPKRYDQYFVLSQKKHSVDTIIKMNDWNPIPYTDKEKEEKNNSFRHMYLGAYPIDKIKIEYKFAINTLKIDSKNNIWVVSSQDSCNIPINIYSYDSKNQCSFLLSGFNEINFDINEKYPAKEKRIVLYKYKLLSK